MLSDVATNSAESDRTQSLPQRGCEVWIGSSQADAAASSRLDDLDENALLQRDGIGIVYIPLSANYAKGPNFDPSSLSTWRTEVSQRESQAMMDVAQVRRQSCTGSTLLRCSKANFEDSTEKIQRLLRAIWLRKKRARESAEWAEQLSRFGKNFRMHIS